MYIYRPQCQFSLKLSAILDMNSTHVIQCVYLSSNIRRAHAIKDGNNKGDKQELTVLKKNC